MAAVFPIILTLRTYLPGGPSIGRLYVLFVKKISLLDLTSVKEIGAVAAVVSSVKPVSRQTLFIVRIAIVGYRSTQVGI